MIINLKDCKHFWIGGIDFEREERITKLLEKLGYTNNKIQAVPHGDLSSGTTKSFIKAFEIAKKENGPVLILEDDVALTDWYSDIVDVPDDADVVYLGTSTHGLKPKWKTMGLWDNFWLHPPTFLSKHNNFFKIQNMLSGHAILHITNKFINDCLPYMRYNINDFMGQDVVWAEMSIKNNYNIYAACHPYFFQDDYGNQRLNTITPLADIKSYYKKNFNIDI